jgi:magnesium-transporting ATPase (P-type)
MAASKATIGSYWSRPIDDLIVALRSIPDGLSTAEATQRPQQFGPNVLKARKTATPLKLFSGQFKSPILVIILVPYHESSDMLISACNGVLNISKLMWPGTSTPPQKF